MIPLCFDVALRVPGGAEVGPDAFFAAASRAARSLPGAGPLINLCEERRNFIVSFAAAMLQGRTILLPASRSPAALAELRARYADSQAIDDGFVAAAGEASGPVAPPAGVAADFIAAIGHTSGSTGVPAAHAKSLSGLATTTTLNAGALREELNRQGKLGRPWVVATVPPQHLYGLETSVLLPLLAGFGVHGGRPLLPADVAATLAEVPSPRVLVTTPVHLRALVESGAEFPPVAIVVSATAPLERELAVRAEQRLGAALIEFFGSTETCVIATRRTAREDGWRPYPGIVLAAEAGGTALRAAWLPGGRVLHDVLELRKDGTFVVVGRGGDVIEVAGKRASLADLTRRLKSIDGVADAVVFQPPAAPGGSAARCAALVVARRLGTREVARRMRALVDGVFVPRPIVIVDELPRNEVGKLPRERLLEAIATASASRPRRGR
jgi:acyl-coenzyme A synthetase/AMP-(fatty) acid ligase